MDTLFGLIAVMMTLIVIRSTWLIVTDRAGAIATRNFIYAASLGLLLGLAVVQNAQAAWPRSGTQFWGDSAGPWSAPRTNPFGTFTNNVNAQCTAVYGSSMTWTTGTFESDGTLQSLTLSVPPDQYQTFGPRQAQCRQAGGTNANQPYSADSRLTIYLYPTCPTGNVEKTIWETTIASGSTPSALLPAGTAPASFCHKHCVIHPQGLTYKAWIEPGHTEVGAKLWVEVQGDLTGAACNPESFSAAARGQSQPAWACESTDQDCGTESGGGSTGLSEEDAANLAGVKDSLSPGGSAYEKLAQIASQSKADAGSLSGLVDCTAGFECNGDAARCAMLMYQREHYCALTASTRSGGAEIHAAGTAAMQRDVTTDYAALAAKGGTVNLMNGVSLPRFLVEAGCPVPIVRDILGRAVSWDFSPLCDMSPFLSWTLIVGASFVAIRIFMGGL
jgi:hypothetical protein